MDKCTNILPGNKGARPINSAKIQPIAQTSIYFSYSDAFNITYGALYHRVTTYLSILIKTKINNIQPLTRSKI